jgi:hypothetical protein
MKTSQNRRDEVHSGSGCTTPMYRFYLANGGLLGTRANSILGCSTGAVNRPEALSGHTDIFYVLPANIRKKRVDPRGLEPLTSAMRERHEGLQEFSGVCKMPANGSILMRGTFLGISEYLLGLLHGCCTAGKACIRTRSGMIVFRAAA